MNHTTPAVGFVPIIPHFMVSLSLEWHSKARDMRGCGKITLLWKGTPLVICAAEWTRGFTSTIMKEPCEVHMKFYLLIVAKGFYFINSRGVENMDLCTGWTVTFSFQHDRKENVFNLSEVQMMSLIQLFLYLIMSSVFSDHITMISPTL